MDFVIGKDAFIDSLFDDGEFFGSCSGSSEVERDGDFMEEVDKIEEGRKERSGHGIDSEGEMQVGRSSEAGASTNEHLSPIGSDMEMEVQTKKEWVPEEGMMVGNVIEAFIKYSKYARRIGFEVRFRSSELSPRSRKMLEQRGVEIPQRQRTNRGVGRDWMHDDYEFCSKVRLQCVKGEKWRSKRGNPDRPVRTQATGCKAGIYLKRNGDDSWQIKKVRLEHNHECDPKCTRFMRNYRKVSGVDQLQIVSGNRAGITPAKGYMNFVVGHCGFENVPFSLKDSHSVLRRWRHKGLESGDFNAMQKFFNEMKSLQDEFYYAYDSDGEGRLNNVFWVDARSRAAWVDFGDVLCFDTTHLKNRYRMPLALFIGVNHHGQSILLGCALLSKEDTDSFKWVFQTWLSCMRNKPPKFIMTDQCQAIGNAVAHVFPNSSHRWCLWHIIKNAELHLRKLEEWSDIRKDLADLLHGACDPVEFEGMWVIFLVNYDLGENEWLTKMYDLRHRWVPAFFLDQFWAGLQSTQRSEGMNNFFRSYVNLNTGLKEFAEQYCLAVGKRVDDEEREDWKSKNKPVKCDTFFPSEPTFQKYYTVRKFLEFQREAKACAYVNTEVTYFDGVVRHHNVTDNCARKGLGRMGTKIFKVSFGVDGGKTYCGCKMFEFKGIICRHILAVWQAEQFADTPPVYIVDRWRKDIVRRSSMVRIPNHNHAFGLTDDAKRCEEMQSAMRSITDLAMGHGGICNVVLEDLDVLHGKCVSLLVEHEPEVRIDEHGRHYKKIQGEEGIDGHPPLLNDNILDPVDRRGRGRVPERRKGAKKGKRKAGKGGGKGKKGRDEALHGNGREVNSD